MDTRNDKQKRAHKTSDPKTIVLRPRKVDYPRRDRTQSEEYAAEVSPLPVQARTNAADEKQADTETKADNGGRTLGYIGLALGIISLFIWSVIMGPIAAVLGYFAYAKGRRTVGAWAMGLGIVAALSYFIMIPFAR